MDRRRGQTSAAPDRDPTSVAPPTPCPSPGPFTLALFPFCASVPGRLLPPRSKEARGDLEEEEEVNTLVL